MSARTLCATCPAKAHNICKPLEAERERELFAHTKPLRWARRQMLFRVGDPVSAVHKITSGMVAISKPMPNGRRQIVDFLLVGDICGFLQSGGRYAYDCEAITDTTTCTVNNLKLRDFVTRYRDVAAALEEAMVERQQRLADHMAAIGQMTSTGKVAYFLTWLSEARRKRGMDTDPLPLPMTRTDIGDFLGVRIETICRILKKLKDHHYLEEVDAEQVVVGRSLPRAISNDGVRSKLAA